MNGRSRRTLGALTGGERAFIIGMTVWFLLQLSRAIALSLIDAIDAGAESKAWMYPAYLDLFAVVFAPPLIWATLKRRGLYTWAFAVMYWTISIVDHTGNFVTTSVVGPPSIAEDMSNPFLIPIIQTVIDAAFVVLLFLPTYRRLFFRTDGSASGS